MDPVAYVVLSAVLFTIGTFGKVQCPQRLSRAHVNAHVNQTLIQAGLRREEIVALVERLNPSCWR